MWAKCAANWRNKVRIKHSIASNLIWLIHPFHRDNQVPTGFHSCFLLCLWKVGRWFYYAERINFKITSCHDKSVKMSVNEVLKSLFRQVDVSGLTSVTSVTFKCIVYQWQIGAAFRGSDNTARLTGEASLKIKTWQRKLTTDVPGKL